MRKLAAFLGLVGLLSLGLAQSAQEILDRVEKNLSTPRQATVQGRIQGPGGEEELLARVYALPQARLFRVEFLKPGSLEGNFTVITEKEVWNYLYLTNQLVISPREKAKIQGLGFAPQGLGDLKALSEQVDLRLEGEVRLPEGMAWKLVGRSKENQGFAAMELYILKADPRPLRFVFLDEKGKVLADLKVVEFKRTNLTEAQLKRYPKDAQVVRR